ncbi:hypothetical protein [Spartinivicinus marinus]|uniref:hypothetical protein n=1 Tax=Spartinivicinus marinus TaxID=2994442 RepID=UPI00224F3129|nr:hypothetical protein [Spartinivicinus marinus]MCX4024752.1 hypothetical protein [Spartinivicinus marinus]
MSIIVLSAVNEMLQSIGESPVTSLGSGFLEAATALDLLDKQNEKIQAIGYPFNTEKNFRLARDIDGIIHLPDNTLKVCGPLIDNGYVKQRGRKLYNSKEQSFTFSASVVVNLVLKIPFDELTVTTRNYITLKAARIFQDRIIGANDLHGYQKQDEEEARRLFLDEVDTEKYNIFHGPMRYDLQRDLF